ASLSPVGDLGYSAIDQIAQFGLSSLKVIYYSEQLFSRPLPVAGDNDIPKKSLNMNRARSSRAAQHRS
ncbi:hypothetical protein, partial [Klebsiella pneumoniae]|uniref:hypothetical protein n=1 Tax=Klebsiella pneumoniae TaxID=573 RepID=UPI002FF0A23B